MKPQAALGFRPSSLCLAVSPLALLALAISPLPLGLTSPLFWRECLPPKTLCRKPSFLRSSLPTDARRTLLFFCSLWPTLGDEGDAGGVETDEERARECCTWLEMGGGGAEGGTGQERGMGNQA